MLMKLICLMKMISDFFFVVIYICNYFLFYTCLFKNKQVFFIYTIMDKTIFTIDGIEYIFPDYERNKEIAELLGVKLSFLLKVNMVCRGTFKATKGITNLIEKYNFRIIPLTQEEIDEVLKKRHENKIRICNEQQANKRQQGNYTEYRRKEGVKPREKKEGLIKEKKERKFKEVKEKVVKEKKIIKEKDRIIKVKPTSTKVTSKILKEMLQRCNGQNTEELWLAYYSVAERLSRKFHRNGRVMMDDMISEAVLVCAKYFVKNANPNYNLFAYLTELCKRSFANSFNILNTYGQFSLSEINI